MFCRPPRLTAKLVNCLDLNPHNQEARLLLIFVFVILLLMMVSVIYIPLHRLIQKLHRFPTLVAYLSKPIPIPCLVSILIPAKIQLLNSREIVMVLLLLSCKEKVVGVCFNRFFLVQNNLLIFI